MTIICVLSIIFLVVIITLLFAAWCKGDDSLAMAGCVIFIVYIIVHLAFQGGAKWQQDFTNENYILTPKTHVKP